jgi:hypothetical protein
MKKLMGKKKHLKPKRRRTRRLGLFWLTSLIPALPVALKDRYYLNIKEVKL